MHQKDIVTAGRSLHNAQKALVMLHGRGAPAEDILSLAPHLQVNEYALIATRAAGNTWYPYSFLSPPSGNEPWLSSAIGLIDEIVRDIEAAGIPAAGIHFLGFSQGACLALEYAARNARKWGGVAAFTGGLIGDKVYTENYSGNFEGTPVFIGTSDPDPHVPVERVRASSEILKKMGASVTIEVYRNMGHTINQDEIDRVNDLIFKDQ